MSRRTKHHGFTLVELLVVISIIGMLMSLLLPAVQSARESGRRMTCSNNINQLAFSSINYESRHNKYPGYAMNSQAQPALRITWGVSLFPYIERDDLWQAWSSPSATYTEPTIRPMIELFVCPSDAGKLNQSAANSYVVNAGRLDATAAANVAMDLAVNGVFHDQFVTTVNHRTVNVASSTITDGTSNTLLFSENLQATNWAPGTLADSDDQQVIEAQTGFVWSGSGDPTVIAINQSRSGPTGAENPRIFARPSSNHPGGINVAFADRGTRFLRENIDPSVLRQLMTPNGRESDVQSGLTTKILDAKDYN